MGKSIPNVRHIVAVSSGKGGVGKSTTAMNLAVALSIQGKKVGLMDADVYGPSQPRMMNLKDAKPESDGEMIEPPMSHGVSVMSMGFLIDESDPMVWRGPMVQSALMQMLFQVNWGELDVLLIDMPPGTGDTQLSLAQQAQLSGAVVVSTPQDIALLDAIKGLNMFKKVNVPILGLIENMSMFICPECGHEAHIFSHNGAIDKANELGIPVLGQVPLDLDIRTTSDEGRPLVVTHPDSPQAKVYFDIAINVWNQLETDAGEAKQTGTGPVKIVFE